MTTEIDLLNIANTIERLIERNIAASDACFPVVYAIRKEITKLRHAASAVESQRGVLISATRRLETVNKELAAQHSGAVADAHVDTPPE